LLSVAAQALFDTYGIEKLKVRIDRIEAEKKRIREEEEKSEFERLQGMMTRLSEVNRTRTMAWRLRRWAGTSTASSRAHDS